MTIYVGLDVSMKETAVCVVNQDGDILKETVLASEPEDISDWINKHFPTVAKIGLEIGGISRWLNQELAQKGLPVICIDPRRLRGVTKTMPVKSDRNDARAIAHVMRTGWYTEVHIKSLRSQRLKMLLTNRRVLLTKVIDIENTIRGTMRVFGFRLTGSITPAAYETRVRELIEERSDLLTIIEPMLIARRAMRSQYNELHKSVLKEAKEDPICRLLMTAPGVGAMTAISYVTTIDDPSRFRRSRDVGAHLGLTPKKYASGEIDRNGAISRHGDASLRAVLYQAALAVMTRSRKWSSLRAWGLQVARRRGQRRAIVAVMRKLAIILHRMWTDGTEYRWAKDAEIV